jgi:hypothetical protein
MLLVYSDETNGDSGSCNLQLVCYLLTMYVIKQTKLRTMSLLLLVLLKSPFPAHIVRSGSLQAPVSQPLAVYVRFSHNLMYVLLSMNIIRKLYLPTHSCCPRISHNGVSWDKISSSFFGNILSRQIRIFSFLKHSLFFRFLGFAFFNFLWFPK